MSAHTPPVPHDQLAVPHPTAVEVMANLLLGRDAPRRELPYPPSGGVRRALERAVLRALQRPPCVVSFSGGRDSSAVLAIAVDVSRRQGLPPPVPVTMRFANAPETDEREWQQLVLEHLAVRNLEVLSLDDDLDALGPIATEAVLRHQVRWPANAYMHVPIIRAAHGGSLLTGVGGDELLGTSAGRRTMLVRQRARPRPADLRVVAAALLPRRARAAVARRRTGSELDSPWLTCRGQRLVISALAQDSVTWPDRWDRSVLHWYRSRAFAAVSGSLPMLANRWNVDVVSPLVDPDVLAALAHAGGPTGWPNRGQAMNELFAGLLPEAVIERRTKAQFSSPLWGSAVRTFARRWDGRGVDPAFVRIEELRREWLSPRPDFRTGLLLHAAWLAGG